MNHRLLVLPPLVVLLVVLASGNLGVRTATGFQRVSRAAVSGTAYAALGASETYGVGAHPRTSAYPFLLAHWLGANRFADLGMSGATLPRAYMIELSRALAIRPTLCTLAFGSNDIARGVPLTEFLTDLRTLAGALRRSGARVLIVGLPDLSLLPRRQRQHIPNLARLSATWNTGMQSVARETGSSFLDSERFDSELKRRPNLISSDGIHPTNAGHYYIAEILLAEIRKDHLWTRPHRVGT